MGKTLHGDNYTNILINLISTITLSNIESKSLELTNLSITNSLEMLLDKIINNNQHSYIKKGDILIIQIDKSENKEQLILNLTTGLIKTVIVNNENIYKGVFSESNSFCFHDDLTDKITSNLLSEIDLPITKLLGGNTPNLKINISYYKECINWWLSTPIVSIASICIDVELSSILTMITTGNWIISFKNNQSTNTWQYYSYQINNMEGRTIYIKNNKTNYIDKIIVPFDDYGNYNRDNVTYIDSIKGAYIIPKNETYKYF
jgi:hypothetical protein